MVRSLSRLAWIPVLIAFPWANDGFAQDWFSTPRHFPETGKGQIRAVADMDQDGDADLIWMSEGSVRVAFNDGAGEFTDGPIFTPSLPLYLPESTWDYPKYAQAGDVDGDGAIDIVLGTDQPWSDAKLFVFLNRGGGNFAQKLVALPNAPDPFGGSMFGTTLGNIDADPALEIATAHDMSLSGLVVDLRAQLTWWDWNGATFVAKPSLVLSGALARIQSIVTVDAGNDGIADIVASGYNGSGQFNSSTIRVMPTVAGSPTPGQSFTVQNHSATLTSGDLDGDGDLDVVAAHRFGCQDVNLIALENQGGVFVRKDSPMIPIGADTCAELPRVVLGDFDGDGDRDAAQTYLFARSYLNDGTNHFAAGGVAKVEIDSAFANTGVGAADLDGDGFDELVCARAIVFTHGQPFASAPATAQSLPQPSVATDVEGDGDVDLLTSQGFTLTNDGTGSFTAASKWVAPPGLVTLSSTAAIGDFTGTGNDDYLVRRVDGPYFQQVFVGMALLADDGTGKYIQTAIVVPAPGSIAPHLDYRVRRGVDADNDGDLDVFVATGHWRNEGPYAAWTFVPTYAASDTTDAADFDLDGDVDTLVVANTSGAASVSVMRNDGGGFSGQVLATATAPGTTFRGLFLDADDDGDRDVAIAAPWGPTALYVHENVSGALGAAMPLQSVVGATGFFGVGDVDGDGLGDIVLERNPTNSQGYVDVEVHRRSGPGLTFEPARHWIGADAHALVDLDEDGDADLVGDVVVKSRAFRGVEDGTIRQYGAGTLGAGAATPVLGASGPLRPGSTTASFRARRCVGGAPGLLFVGVNGPASYPHVLPSGSFLVQVPITAISFQLAGPAGWFTKGTLDIDTSPILPSIAGLGVWHQLVVIDSHGAGGIASSNGLELHYGM